MRIAKEIMSISSKNVYYQTSTHIPKTDEAGQEVFSKMTVDKILDVWLMHPDLLPGFKQVVQNAGKYALEFDLADYLTASKPMVHADPCT